jgi:hypothetical protein
LKAPKRRQQKSPTCLSSDPWPTTGWKTEGTCPSGGPKAAAQWPPRPPYPCATTGQG